MSEYMKDLVKKAVEQNKSDDVLKLGQKKNRCANNDNEKYQRNNTTYYEEIQDMTVRELLDSGANIEIFYFWCKNKKEAHETLEPFGNESMINEYELPSGNSYKIKHNHKLEITAFVDYTIKS